MNPNPIDDACIGHRELCDCATCVDARYAYLRKLGLCPSCGMFALTRHEIANHYQCPNCTSRDEGNGY